VAKRKPRRLHVCSDETGQDTSGEFFLVATVIVGGVREELVEWLEQCERKIDERPCSRAEFDRRYSETVLTNGRLHGSMFYSIHTATTAYRACTIASIRLAVDTFAPDRDYEADIVVDGLNPSDIRRFATELRSVGIPVRRVRGARDEADAMTRLSDSLATFARAGSRGQRSAVVERFERLVHRGAIRQV
jgi:hypothetical protein